MISSISAFPFSRNLLNQEIELKETATPHARAIVQVQLFAVMIMSLKLSFTQESWRAIIWLWVMSIQKRHLIQQLYLGVGKAVGRKK
jgi:hypothetical protein